jgi:hypothetical protein
MSNEEIIKSVRRLRNVHAAAIEELDKILLDIDSAPRQRKRRNLKEKRVEEFETNYTLGTWKKPAALRKTK